MKSLSRRAKNLASACGMFLLIATGARVLAHETIRYIPIYNGSQPNKIIYNFNRPLSEKIALISKPTSLQELRSAIQQIYSYIKFNYSYRHPIEEKTIITTEEINKRKSGLCLHYCIVFEEQLTRLGIDARTIIVRTENFKHSLVFVFFENKIIVFDPISGEFTDSNSLYDAVTKNIRYKGYPCNLSIVRLALEQELDESSIEILSTNKDSKQNTVKLVSDFTIPVDKPHNNNK